MHIAIEGEKTAEESKKQEQTQESSDVEKVQGQEV
jgi:hypothetical protein